MTLTRVELPSLGSPPTSQDVTNTSVTATQNMALRRRIGISTATTEAARRQLMQPVPCWEKVWVVPEKAAPGSTLKVLKWVKTYKVQVLPGSDGAYAHAQ